MGLNQDPKVAVLRDRLEHFHGAGREAFKIADIFEAPIYTYTSYEEFSPNAREEALERGIEIVTRKGSTVLPLPKDSKTILFFEELELPDFDAVVSVGPLSKGYEASEGQNHLSYFNAPFGPLWQNYRETVDNMPFPKDILFRTWAHIYREWELSTLKKIDLLVANSEYSAKLARKYWNKKTEVIYPPVPTRKFRFEGGEDFYFLIGRIGTRQETVMRAFEGLPYKLKVAGPYGDSAEKISKKLENVELLGPVYGEKKTSLFARCRGVICNKSKEHFGIVPVEAMASGKPVIALREGGYTVTVEDGKTGVFFEKPTLRQIRRTIEKCESINWSHEKIQKHSRKFDESIFAVEISKAVKGLVNSSQDF